MTTTPGGPRGTAQRITDTLAQLRAPVDAWVSTADGSGEPYLIPLSLAWVAERVVLATSARSRTAVNLHRGGKARLGLGPTRDVVLIDAVLEALVPVPEAPAELAEGFAGQADWDPRSAGDGDVYLVLRPVRIQAWREVDELAGRTVMRAGVFLS